MIQDGEQLKTGDNKPLSVLGHSSGSVLALEMCRALQKHYNYLFVCSLQAPHVRHLPGFLCLVTSDHWRAYQALTPVNQIPYLWTCGGHAQEFTTIDHRMEQFMIKENLSFKFSFFLHRHTRVAIQFE
jgi:surfactin synthase thioesterase subunit